MISRLALWSLLATRAMRLTGRACAVARLHAPPARTSCEEARFWHGDVSPDIGPRECPVLRLRHVPDPAWTPPRQLLRWLLDQRRGGGGWSVDRGAAVRAARGVGLERAAVLRVLGRG